MRSVPRVVDAWADIMNAITAARSGTHIRPEVELDDVPAPARLAHHALAIAGEITQAERELGHGRFVLLHEPGGQSAWDGDTRAVIFVKAMLEPDVAVDPLLLDVGWDWLEEALERHSCNVTALSGTVSRSGSQAFGDIAGRDPEGAIEVRASWTLTPEAAATSLLAWCDLLATASGLTPLSEGVRHIRSRS